MLAAGFGCYGRGAGDHTHYYFQCNLPRRQNRKTG